MNSLKSLIQENIKFDDYNKKNYQGNYTKASVLIPLFEKNSELHVLFTKRSDKVKHHKGQISFPGGKYEEDDNDLKITAIRETVEEIGIDNNSIEIIGNLDNIITITNFQVTPFIGFISENNFNFNTDEISEIIEAPLKHFLNEEVLEIKKQFGYEIYYYNYLNYTIWGATGKILYDFIKVIK